MSEPFLCWCPRAIEDHAEDGACPTRTEWLEIEDSEMDLYDLAEVAAEFGVDL